MPSQDEVCIFTIGDAAYFPGLVALLNSLIITGHDYPVVVGDCGLTEAQARLLRGCHRCSLMTLDASLVQNPQQYKAFAYLAEPKGVVVIIDSDMVVTDSLAPIIARARQGKFCAFPNPEKRWFSEWQHIFGLSAAPRRQNYVCSGFQAFSTEHWPDLLPRWWAACRTIASHPTYQESGDLHGPTSQADQDALNALLMSEYPEDAVFLERFEGQVHRPDLRHVKLLDLKTLNCRFQERRPMILHASMTPKPWVPGGAMRDTFFRFMQRLLTEPDLAIRVPTAMLDPMLVPGPSGWLRRHCRFVANMGLFALLLSYGPHGFGLKARRTKAALRRKVSNGRHRLALVRANPREVLWERAGRPAAASSRTSEKRPFAGWRAISAVLALAAGPLAPSPSAENNGGDSTIGEPADIDRTR